MSAAVSAPDRRPVRYASLEDILADLESLGPAPRSTGGWTAAQNVQHVRKFVTGSIDGFDMRAPLPMRVFGRFIRGMVLRAPMKPGFRLPNDMSAFRPDEGVTWDAAVEELRREVLRLRDGARMTAPSPVFGRLSHEQWERLHCRHAELHCSFIHPS